MKLTNFLIIGSASALGLAACSSGGNSDNTQPLPPPPAQSAAVIDAGNAMMIAGVAAEAALETGELGGLTDLTGATASALGGVNKADTMAAATKVVQDTLGGAAINYIPFGPETAFCAVSGTVTTSGDIADPTTFSTGDVIAVDSDMCNDGTGSVVDGLLEMTITNFDGDLVTSEFLFGVDLVVTDFMVTEEGESNTANGDISTTIDTRTPPVAVGSVFGDSFVVAGMGSTESIRDFLTTYTEDSSVFPIAWTNSSMGEVDSSDFEGFVTYSTPATLQGFGEEYPSIGELLVTGSNGATLHLVTTDNVFVEIFAD
jgi:hypothetical protein